MSRSYDFVMKNVHGPFPVSPARNLIFLFWLAVKIVEISPRVNGRNHCGP